jgi:hypothetical protein
LELHVMRDRKTSERAESYLVFTKPSNHREVVAHELDKVGLWRPAKKGGASHASDGSANNPDAMTGSQHDGEV